MWVVYAGGVCQSTDEILNLEVGYGASELSGLLEGEMKGLHIVTLFLVANPTFLAFELKYMYSPLDLQ